MLEREARSALSGGCVGWRSGAWRIWHRVDGMEKGMTLFTWPSLFVVSLAVLLASGLSAQLLPPDPRTTIRLGGAADRLAAYVQPTPDGGLIIGGQEGCHALFVRTFGGPGFNPVVGPFESIVNKVCKGRLWKDPSGFPVQVAHDDGFVVAGQARGETGFQHMYLGKVDGALSQVWEKTYPGAEGRESYGFALAKTKDQGYLIAGATLLEKFRTENGVGYDSKVFLVKTNIQGEQEWSRILGPFSSVAYSVQESKDEGFILAGRAGYDLFTEGLDVQVYLLKTDPSGNLLWERSFGKRSTVGNSVFLRDEQAYSVIETSTGDLVIAATDHNTNFDNERIYIIKTDSYGNLLWEKYLPGESVYSVSETLDGRYLFAGRKRFTSRETIFTSYLFKLDQDGALVWDILFAPFVNTPEGLLDAKQLKGGTYVAVGWDQEAGQLKRAMVKTLRGERQAPPPEEPPPQPELLQIPITIPKISRVNLRIPWGDSSISVDLSLKFSENGKLVCGGSCIADGTTVNVKGSIKRRGALVSYKITIKSHERYRFVSGSISGLYGSGIADVKYRGTPSGYTATGPGAFDVKFNLKGHPVSITPEPAAAANRTAEVSLKPELGENGKITGTGTIAGAFLDEVQSGELKGKLKGNRLAWKLKAGKQVLSFKGERSDAGFVGVLKVKLPPEKSVIVDYQVPDVFQ